MASSGTRPACPFRLLYSNDLTNTLSCVSPWHAKDQPFTPGMLQASVDEAQGVDVHMLQPGLCWVPLWKSETYPLAEHAAWLQEKYGLTPDPFAQSVLAGNDLLQVFVDRCRQQGQAPFISFRLNDGHHKEWVNTPKGDYIATSAAQGITRFYAEHPEYRIGPDIKDWSERVWNWAIPEVRAHRLAYLRELCTQYDIDGLELDFLRQYSLFDLKKTTADQRRQIMVEFVSDVRRLLNETAKAGQRRWLCVRVPCYVDVFDALGIDLPAFWHAGVDMVNASSHYFTTQQQDLTSIREQVPEASLYFEMCHSTWNGARLTEGYDSFEFRRTTKEQFLSTAHLAYACGAQGVSLFNFAYFREHGGAGRGPFHEPPFELLKVLRDPAAVSLQPQHWFIAQGWRGPGMKPTPIPKRLRSGQSATFVLDLAPPGGVWHEGGRLRIQTQQSLGASLWQAKLNGVVLSPDTAVAEPYANPDPGLLGQPGELRAWRVPAAILRAGKNELTVTYVDQPNAQAVNIVFVDLAAH